jgi:multidrug efflux pump subunit AcrB
MIGFIAGAGLDAAVIDAGAVRFRPMMLTAAWWSVRR